MANRQALRDLQNRLAQRLQQARSEGVAVGWLAVEVLGRNCLLPLAQAGEIFPYVATQRVPYTQQWFLGVANLRGGLYGIVDLASFLTGTALSRKLDGLLRDQARMVALNGAMEVNCALLVDRLNGLRGPQDFSQRDAPAIGSPAFVSAVYIDNEGRDWTEINLQALASTPEFLNIAEIKA